MSLIILLDFFVVFACIALAALSIFVPLTLFFTADQFLLDGHFRKKVRRYFRVE